MASETMDERKASDGALALRYSQRRFSVSRFHGAKFLLNYLIIAFLTAFHSAQITVLLEETDVELNAILRYIS